MTEHVPEHLKHIPELAMRIWFEEETHTFEQNELQELREYLITKIKNKSNLKG